MEWIYWTNDGGLTTLQWAISKLTDMYNNLSSQLGNYSNSTLEWQQSIDALTNRMSLYQQAINQYQDLIWKIQWSDTEAKRWSAMKQQAKQWYITGMSTKRWQTSAEALKDMADIEATWAAERADIRSQEAQNLASAKWWLSNLYMQMAKQQAAVDAANASKSSWYSSWWWLSSALGNYVSWDWDVTQDDVDAVIWQPTDDTLAKMAIEWKNALTWNKKKNNRSFLDIYKMLPYLDPGPIWMAYKWKWAYDNIFKKLTNK